MISCRTVGREHMKVANMCQWMNLEDWYAAFLDNT